MALINVPPTPWPVTASRL